MQGKGILASDESNMTTGAGLSSSRAFDKAEGVQELMGCNKLMRSLSCPYSNSVAGYRQEAGRSGGGEYRVKQVWHALQ